MKPKWLLAIFCLAHAVVFFLFFTNLYQGYSAAELYYYFASRVLNGEVLYRDFTMEYPPLAMAFFILPRLISSNLAAYSIAFSVEMFLFDLLGLFLISSLSRKLGLSHRSTLGIYTLTLLALGPMVAQRFDLVPAIMVLLALYFFYRGKHKISWVCLALGTMTKLYPAIIAPIFVLYYVRHRQFRRIRDGVVTFAVVTLAIGMPFVLLSPAGFLGSFTYHTARGLQIESIYASLLLLGQYFNPALSTVVFDFGSWNIVGPLADVLAKVSIPLLLLPLALVYWLFYRRTGTGRLPGDALVNQPEVIPLVQFSVAAVLGFIITGKILSPQFLVWLYPLLPLAAARWRGLWVTFIIIALMTYYIYPLHYAELVFLGHAEIAILFLRNLVLAAMFGGLLWNLRATGSQAAPEYLKATPLDGTRLPD